MSNFYNPYREFYPVTDEILRGMIGIRTSYSPPPAPTPSPPPHPSTPLSSTPPPIPGWTVTQGQKLNDVFLAMINLDAGAKKK